MGYIVGIDLGTTFSAAATSGDGHAEIFSLGRRTPTIPSVLFQREDGALLVGEPAERRSISDPSRGSRQFKRRFGDPAPIFLGQTPHTADSLMAHLYRAIADAVVEQQGGPPDGVVVTHPANYGPYKLELLAQALATAGIDNPRFISEPEAAAVHYAGQERIKPGELVAVYDLGGGTFDAAVLRKTPAGFDLLGTPEGLTYLGGVDFDVAIVAYVNRELAGRLEQLDHRDPAVLSAAVRLRNECTAAKEALSFDTEASISVLFPSIQAEVRLTRDDFEEMILPRIGETIAALRRVVSSAGLTMGDLTRILLVGGSSRIPLIRRTVADSTDRPVAVDIHPKFAVAVGAVLSLEVAPEPPLSSSLPGRLGAIGPDNSSAAIPDDPERPGGPPVLNEEPRPWWRRRSAGAGDAEPGAARRIPATVAVAAVVALLAGAVGAFLVTRPGPGTRYSAVTSRTSPAGAAGAVSPGVVGWRGLRDVPTARQQATGAVADGTLWVLGGLGDGGATPKVEGYDPAIDTWKAGPDLPLPLHHAMAVTYRDELVVLGGWVPQGADLSAAASDRVFVLRGGSWAELPRLRRPRAAGAAVVADDRIVVVGGQAGGALVAPTEVFDGTQWRDAPALPTPRDHLAAVSDGRFVYVVGGRLLAADKNLPTFERYDPTTRHWSRLPDLPTARGDLGAALVGRRLLTLGGEQPTGVFDTVESFDLDARTWSALPPMRTPRHGMAVLSLGTSVYTLAGAHEPTHAHASHTADVLDVR